MVARVRYLGYKKKFDFWLFWLSRQVFNMKISCSQMDLPNLGLKCLKMGPKPRQLEVGGSKSIDFTIKKSYIVDPFSWWYL